MKKILIVPVLFLSQAIFAGPTINTFQQQKQNLIHVKTMLVTIEQAFKTSYTLINGQLLVTLHHIGNDILEPSVQAINNIMPLLDPQKSTAPLNKLIATGGEVGITLLGIGDIPPVIEAIQELLQYVNSSLIHPVEENLTPLATALDPEKDPHGLYKSLTATTQTIDHLITTIDQVIKVLTPYNL